MTEFASLATENPKLVARNSRIVLNSARNAAPERAICCLVKTVRLWSCSIDKSGSEAESFISPQLPAAAAIAGRGRSGCCSTQFPAQVIVTTWRPHSLTDSGTSISGTFEPPQIQPAHSARSAFRDLGSIAVGAYLLFGRRAPQSDCLVAAAAGEGGPIGGNRQAEKIV